MEYQNGHYPWNNQLFGLMHIKYLNDEITNSYSSFY